jgi:hypothetical protein
VSGFPEQTVVKQGSLVFCVSKSSEDERERRSPPERMSVFAGNDRHRAHPHEGFDIILLLKEFPYCFSNGGRENTPAYQEEKNAEDK